MARPFVKVRIVDGLTGDFLSGFPRKGCIAICAPHLVASFNFVDPRSAFRTWFGRCEDQVGGLYVFLLTNVRVVVRLEAFMTHFHTANTALMVPACNESATVVRRTWAHYVRLLIDEVVRAGLLLGSKFFRVQGVGDDILERTGQVHSVAPFRNIDPYMRGVVPEGALFVFKIAFEFIVVFFRGDFVGGEFKFELVNVANFL